MKKRAFFASSPALARSAFDSLVVGRDVVAALVSALLAVAGAAVVPPLRSKLTAPSVLPDCIAITTPGLSAWAAGWALWGAWLAAGVVVLIFLS